MDMTEIKKALEETFGQIRDAQTKSLEEVRTELKTLDDKLSKTDINMIDLGQKLAGLSVFAQSAFATGPLLAPTVPLTKSSKSSA
jgi:hypothetical protein